jgi:Domain of unknown function (DUF6468)
VSYSIGFMIESLVALLLLITIGYCVLLNNRLKRLKGDEQSLKATISELITATEIAGRAVAGLKAAAQDCDQTLGERMRVAERLSAELERQIRAGEAVQLAAAAAPPPPPPLPPPVLAVEPDPGSDKSDPKSVVAAARAFAQRTRERARGRAA